MRLSFSVSLARCLFCPCKVPRETGSCLSNSILTCLHPPVHHACNSNRLANASPRTFRFFLGDSKKTRRCLAAEQIFVFHRRRNKPRVAEVYGRSNRLVVSLLSFLFFSFFFFCAYVRKIFARVLAKP